MSSFRQVGTGLLPPCLLLRESQDFIFLSCRPALKDLYGHSGVIYGIGCSPQTPSFPARLENSRHRRRSFPSQKTPNNRFPTATRVQELSHANGSNKHNLNPRFSFYGSFIFSILYSNFPPFSLASFYFAAKPYRKWEGNY